MLSKEACLQRVKKVLGSSADAQEAWSAGSSLGSLLEQEPCGDPEAEAGPQTTLAEDRSAWLGKTQQTSGESPRLENQLGSCLTAAKSRGRSLALRMRAGHRLGRASTRVRGH